jgi:hypothetical protein
LPSLKGRTGGLESEGRLEGLLVPLSLGEIWKSRSASRHGASASGLSNLITGAIEQLGSSTAVRGPKISVDAFLTGIKRTSHEAAVYFHGIPARLDATHFGFVFTDVIGNGHRDVPRFRSG